MISIIVPIYNAERYLNKCIDSILSQSFVGFELVLINDGSTDSSGAICEKYAVMDNRVKVFHKKNGGVGSARNMGLEKATGDWVMFVDADDWIELDCLEVCYRSLHNNIELLVFSCNWAADSLLPDRICSTKSDFKEILPLYIDKVVFTSPWCKLFKRSKIEELDLKFNEELMFFGEDTLFVFEYLKNIKSMQLLSKQFYHYVSDNNQNSLSKKKDLDWFTKSYFLKKIFTAVSDIESVWDTQLIKYRCLTCELILNKYLYALSYTSFARVKDGLKNIISCIELKYIFEDRKYLPKGERRKLFDFLVQYKLITLLAIYVKFIRAEY